MISTSYQDLADYVAGFAHRGVVIEPRLAAILATALLDLADQAKLLERSTIIAQPAVYACEHDGDGE